MQASDKEIHYITKAGSLMEMTKQINQILTTLVITNWDDKNNCF
jgi:hypothetical protein